LFTSLADLDFVYTLARNGKTVAKGRVIAPALAPQDSMTVTPDFSWSNTTAGNYTLTVRAYQNNDTDWADSGYEVGFTQFAFEIKEDKIALIDTSCTGLVVTQTAN
jgi:hypothetical protein